MTIDRIDTSRSRSRRRRAAATALVAGQVALGTALAGAAHAATTERVSISPAGVQGNGPSAGAAVSSDGSAIAFSSAATNLAGGITLGQVYVRDKIRGTTEIVSMGSVGGGLGLPNGRALAPSMSDNGRFVAFQSFASNLVSGDVNGADDIFVRDRQTGTTTLASVSSSGVQGNAVSSAPAISGDGRFVAFASSASTLVSGDTNGTTDVFVRDLVTRTTTRASVGTTGVAGNSVSTNPSLSRDGSRVAFESFASNLVGGADTNRFMDVFVGTRTGVQLRASQSSAGTQGNSTSRNPDLSDDGTAVAFESRATNLSSGDTNSRTDVFHHDLGSRRTTRVVNAAGSGLTDDPGNGDSVAPSISPDGRIVAFSSTASNLVAGDANGAVQDVFVADLNAFRGSQNRLVSLTSGGGGANGTSSAAALSSNGQVVAFASAATNLVAGDTNATTDVFARRP